MKTRFEGDGGRRLLIDTLVLNRFCAGSRQLAEEVADLAALMEAPKGTPIIEQEAVDNDMYLILSGGFEVYVNNRLIGRREPGNHVGEMAAVEPIQKRAATIIAIEDSVVARITEDQLSRLASKYPDIWRRMAQELARRLRQRNLLISAPREKIRIFIISSAEALAVARLVQNAFAHDDFITKVWTDGVFKVNHYALQSLETELDQSDFGVAIAHTDDVTTIRGTPWPAPRDNVILELGMFMGRLGRDRAILMEPRGVTLKLPSDMAGLTAIPYRYEKGPDEVALIAPACNALRDHINRLGRLT